MMVYGEVAAPVVAKLAAQNVGRTGPIFLDGGGPTGASLFAVALLLAAMSGAVVLVSARQGAPRLAVGWAAACALSVLAAAYFLWGLVGTG